MAIRKRQPQPETEAKTIGGVSEYPAPTVVLNEADFGTFVRMVKSASFNDVVGMKTAIDVHLKRLKIRAKNASPVAGMPAGSGQVDVGSMVAWAASVTKADVPARQQLLKLAATINARVS